MKQIVYTQQNIRAWLNRLNDILDPPRSRRYDYEGSRGSKPYDGITSGRLTAIMLRSALEALPGPLYRVALQRWVYSKPLAETLHTLGLTKAQYYYRCDKVVQCIMHYCNGEYDKLRDVARCFSKSA